MTQPVVVAGGGRAGIAPPPPGADVGVHRFEVETVSRRAMGGVLDMGFGMHAHTLLSATAPGGPGIAAVRAWVDEHGPTVYVQDDGGRRRGGLRCVRLVEAPAPSYTYQAGRVRVVDGDTMDAELHLGWGILLDAKLRLAGVNAPELKTVPGADASAWVRAWIDARPSGVIVRTVKDRREKYGRLLATVEHDGATLNEALVAAGIAQPYDGGART